jgi:predicted RNA methylase
MGVNGSINPLAVFGMLMAMKVEGRTVFDFGCSEGRFLLAAALQGARKAIGIEFPENSIIPVVAGGIVYVNPDKV